MTERIMAKVVRVEGIKPITGADAIELALIGGWQVVVKKGEYTAGMLAVYIEIDAFLAEGNPHWQFLMERSSRPFEGKRGHVLKTIKLRGEVSQGLLLPLSVLPENYDIGDDVVFDAKVWKECQDVSEVLGIVKYEPPLPNSMGQMKYNGLFVGWIEKTDEERCQNFKGRIEGEWQGQEWDSYEKLDGTSATFYLESGVTFDFNGDSDYTKFGACSRNFDLAESDNVYWTMARKLELQQKMRDNDLSMYALQGEIVGPGVGGNPLDLSELDFYLFTVQHKGIRAENWEVDKIAAMLGLKRVPYLGKVKLETVAKLLADVDGMKSTVNPKRDAEGIVLRDPTSARRSFKVISNKYLLKNDR